MSNQTTLTGIAAVSHLMSELRSKQTTFELPCDLAQCLQVLVRTEIEDTIHLTCATPDTTSRFAFSRPGLWDIVTTEATPFTSEMTLNGLRETYGSDRIFAIRSDDHKDGENSDCKYVLVKLDANLSRDSVWGYLGVNGDEETAQEIVRELNAYDRGHVYALHQISSNTKTNEIQRKTIWNTVGFSQSELEHIALWAF
ncbi:MAG: hypothetical protein Q4P71_09055 [Actinomycetaceae bacterium]|nr:hypothetical protein [Actinomycetaceae bacterium]